MITERRYNMQLRNAIASLERIEQAASEAVKEALEAVRVVRDAKVLADQADALRRD